MGHDIIIIAADPWEHYTWRRRHHVAWNLAKDNRVLFVEPPLSIFDPFRDIDLSWRHILNLGRLKHQGRNLYSYSPWRKYPLSLPFSSILDYVKMNRKSVIQGIKKAVDKLKFKNPILWIYYHPYHYDYYGLFGEKLTVTDWYDKFTASAGVEIQKNEISKIKNMESHILKKADVVFAVSTALAKDVEERNKNVYVIPQGVDIDSFLKNYNKKNKISKRLRHIKHPILGFLGIMHNKVDFDLLDYIATRQPAWSIVLAGREWLKNKDDIKRYKTLKTRENVHYIGEIQRQWIPVYLGCIDVCLIPMKKMEFNRYAAFLKVMEYLAAGKPIVAVAQEIEYDHSEFIKTAQNRDEFLDRIEESILEGKNEILEARRKKIASENSWEIRVKSMLRIIEKKKEEKHID